MSESVKRDLEERHRLGRAEYKRRLIDLKVVTDDISRELIAYFNTIGGFTRL